MTHPRSSLTETQREHAVALFEQGFGYESTATRLEVNRRPIYRLYDRWRVQGNAALMTKPTKQTFTAEFKISLVERFLAGETKLDLAREFDLSSPKIIEHWARIYRREGPEGLQPKRRGRPPAHTTTGETDELARLRRENERLRAHVAYLGKVRALTRPQRD